MDIREVAVEVLDDGHGISERAWYALRAYLEEQGGCEDIIDAVDMQCGRVYLPLDCGVLP